MLGEPETPYGRLREKAKWQKGEIEKEKVQTSIFPQLPNPNCQPLTRGVETYAVNRLRCSLIGRRTQVVKGEVCKTSIHRFESGRRLN